MREVHISKRDIRDTRIVDVPLRPLADGAARLKLDLFAITSNNVTYAAMGEGVLGYWDFFPAPEGFGKVPVWGFATVVESNAPGVEVGARHWGYYPLAEGLDVTPAKAGPSGFTDAAPHRAAKAPIYNRYVNTNADPAYDAAYEAEQTLHRPLYGTGWWLADCAAQGEPRTIVLSSASSKTALATAHQLRKRGGAELIALTSSGNAAYVEDTDLYHRVITYSTALSLKAEAAVVYIDFLGRSTLTQMVHEALGEDLVRSIVVGATDWTAAPGGLGAPQQSITGPTPEFFFVPTYAGARLKSDPTLGAKMQADMRAFYPASRAFVTAQHVTGAEAILAAWSRLAAGQVLPREGVVGSF